MKKKLFGLLVITLLIASAIITKAQVEDPVLWNYTTKKINIKRYEIVIKATIDKNWHLYSLNMPDGGPLPTVFSFTPAPNYKLIGNISEVVKPQKEFDKVFEMDVFYFAEEAIFRQEVELSSDEPTTINGTIEYQACIEGKCIFLVKEFSVTTSDGKGNVATTNKVTKKVVLKTTTDTLSKVKEVQIAELKLAKGAVNSPKVENLDQTKGKSNESKSFWPFFLVSFLSGLLAILTPCVFPMIPMTVSFFMHGGKSKVKAKMEALFYGFSIIFIYTVIGTLVAFTLGPSFANFLSTHWLPNIFFFIIFLVFAFSFFGMFEIVLPSWLVNKADKQVDKGGFWGPFFMAFTLVLVSFSCTGPIVGAVLVQSAGGAFLKPIIGMLGFSLAFALPFTLFAFFPSWLSNLPRSGGWLNTVKVILGFIELGLGLKFLSMADLTYHWGLLDREVYIAFWIVLTFMLGIYLLGKIRFAHDDEKSHVGVPKLLMAILAFTFGVYMVPGLWGAPLKALSGYIPPMTTQDFDIQRIVGEDQNDRSVDNNLSEKPLYSDFLKLPHGINGFFDWDQALTYSKKVRKPIFVDFTGHGCANCRKMEENVWVDHDILKSLKDDYVILSLYVDDKTQLPENAWLTTSEGKVIKTLGSKNSYIQQTKFGVNSQPHYVILDGDGNQLGTSKFFDLNIDGFKQYLAKGVENYKNNNKLPN